MFTTHLVLVDITWALLTFFIVGFHSTFNRFILEFRLKQQIKKQFEHYLDPRQVAALQKNPDLLKLGGDRREMSFLFMDIIGFTPISEFYKNKDDPEGLVVLVNEFLDEMTTIILNNGGMVDKFMGDCIMAVFNAPVDMPNHAEMAVKSAIEIEAKTLELKARYKLTASPITEKSNRVVLPMLPTIAVPVFTPVPTLISGSPRSLYRALSSNVFASISIALLTAISA